MIRPEAPWPVWPLRTEMTWFTLRQFVDLVTIGGLVPPGRHGGPDWVTDQRADLWDSLESGWWALAAAGATISAGLTWRLPANDPGDSFLLAGWLLLGIAGVLLSTIDIVVHRLPTPIIVYTGTTLAALIATSALISHRPVELLDAAVALAVFGTSYLALAVLSPKGVGLGDVRLSAVLGLALGALGWRPVLLGFILPYVIAGPFAATQIMLGRLDRRDPVPFGPFLIAGALASVVLLRP